MKWWLLPYWFVISLAVVGVVGSEKMVYTLGLSRKDGLDINTGGEVLGEVSDQLVYWQNLISSHPDYEPGYLWMAREYGRARLWREARNSVYAIPLTYNLSELEMLIKWIESNSEHE